VHSVLIQLEEATIGTIASMGVGRQTLEQNTHRLCWPLPGRMFLIIVNSHSKWLEVHVMQSASLAVTIEKLQDMF